VIRRVYTEIEFDDSPCTFGLRTMKIHRAFRGESGYTTEEWIEVKILYLFGKGIAFFGGKTPAQVIHEDTYMWNHEKLSARELARKIKKWSIA